MLPTALWKAPRPRSSTWIGRIATPPPKYQITCLQLNALHHIVLFPKVPKEQFPPCSWSTVQWRHVSSIPSICWGLLIGGEKKSLMWSFQQASPWVQLVQTDINPPKNPEHFWNEILSSSNYSGSQIQNLIIAIHTPWAAPPHSMQPLLALHGPASLPL